MKRKPSIRNSDSGFSLLELLVASALTVALLFAAGQAATSAKSDLSHHFNRTQLHYSLKNTLSLLGDAVSHAGENLPANFPAINLEDGGDKNSDQLILRRSLSPVVFSLCAPLTSGSAKFAITVARLDGRVTDDFSSPECRIDTGMKSNVETWRSLRKGTRELELPGYIFDLRSRRGEFFTYTGESETADSVQINTSTGSWQHSYSPLSSAVILIEESRFRLKLGRLERVRNEALLEAEVVSDKISDFRVVLTLDSGSQRRALDETSTIPWPSVSSIGVTIQGLSGSKAHPILRTNEGHFTPRSRSLG